MQEQNIIAVNDYNFVSFSNYFISII